MATVHAAQSLAVKAVVEAVVAREAAVRGGQAARHAVEPSSITHCTSMRSPTCHPVESSLKVETHCLGRRLRRAPGATASLHAAQAALRVA